jgi:cell division protein FtsW (lipid II flippase)
MWPLHTPTVIDRVQARLLNLAALFIVLYATILSLSPSARLHTWSVNFRWQHWLGVMIWLLGVNLAHRQLAKHLPGRDPYLLPLAALLSGWGMLTIWRLSASFGLRQSAWLLAALLIFTLGLRLPVDLDFLRRYKYIWLTGGLLLTALTLIFGTNPVGAGLPRLWLGCCGFYFQPSEPLKLLLIVYLASYLASIFSPVVAMHPFKERYRQNTLQLDRAGGAVFLPQIAPTILMTGLAIALLLVQRDLGTAAIFLFLYAIVVYLATGNKWIVISSLLALVLAAILGYVLFDVVRLRIDAWLNPWLDPSGRSYQIVQSLLAVANGGIFGRGPGMGNPGLVPVARSDFIFAAIAEENGLLGTLALLLLLGLLAVRGIDIALHAADRFRRFLAAGLTAHLVAQSVLIVGGNLRLLPLTGVTLPFVSYGGSSLLTSFVSILILCLVSFREEVRPAPLPDSRRYLQLAGVLLAGIAAASLANGWWALVRAPALLTRTDNPRRAIADRYVPRGSILDRSSLPLTETVGKPGDYTRHIVYPNLSPVIGYNSPVYGQSGLEASMDAYLRGVKGYPGLTVWWDHLLYGQPPPGLDIRTSLDLNLQGVADEKLGDHAGALVLLNAATGEILAMASHPTFNADQLDENWQSLINNAAAPLFNRAALGRYSVNGLKSQLFPEGLPRPALQVPLSLGLPLQPSANVEPFPDRLSPIQVALLGAVLSNGGISQPLILVSAVDTPQAGWVILPVAGKPLQVLNAEAASLRIAPFALPDGLIWQIAALASNDSPQAYTWYLGGTLPAWSGTPFSLALLLETADTDLAASIGQSVLQAAMGYNR